MGNQVGSVFFILYMSHVESKAFEETDKSQICWDPYTQVLVAIWVSGFQTFNNKSNIF